MEPETPGAGLRQIGDGLYGRAEPVAPAVRRLLADNPSAFTYSGTQTYLVGDRALAVIDPGPDLPGHVEAIMAAAGDAPIEFLKRCFFQVVDYDEEGSYKALAARLAELDHAHTDAARTLFYLATPPDVAQAVVERLGRSGLAARRARWMDSHRARETVRQRSPDREAHEQRAQRGFRGIPDLSHRPLSG